MTRGADARKIFAWTAAAAVTLAAGALPADAGIAVSGRATVSDGTPLAEARVSLHARGSTADRIERILESAGNPGGSEPAPSPEDFAAPAALDAPEDLAITAEDGWFRLEAPHAGIWIVRIEAPGLAPLEKALEPLIEPVDLVDAVLLPDTGMTIRVNGPDGEPVAGARVAVASERGSLPWNREAWRPPVRAGLTGADGRVRLARAEDEETRVAVFADGFAPEEARHLRGTAASVRLAKGARRAVRVSDAAGRPVKGARLSALHPPLPAATTDDAGLAALPVAPSSRVAVAVRAPDGARVEATLEAPAAGEAGAAPVKPLALTLPARMPLSGRLIDADSRRPVAGGVVWPTGDPAAAAISNADGAFTVALSSREFVRIAAGAAGYLPPRHLAFSPGGPERPAPVIALEPAASIAGTVTDGDGKPVRRAEIGVREKRAPGMFGIEIGAGSDPPRALSGSRGGYRIGPLDPEKSWVVSVEAEGFAPAEIIVASLEPYRTREGVDFVLDRGRAVAGRIVGPEGEPVGGAAVALTATPEGDRLGGRLRVMPGEGAPPTFEDVSDEEGRFRVEGLSTGRFDLEAARPGFADATLTAIRVEAANETTDVGDVVLEPGAVVSGRVTDGEGLPVEDVEVFVNDSGGMMFVMAGPMGGDPETPEPDAVTDPSGWFRVEDLAPGRKVSLRFQRNGYIESSAGPLDVPREEPLAVTMQAASTVSGRILTTGGEPIPGARVNMTRSRTMEMGGNVMKAVMVNDAVSDASGRYVFENQRPGALSLSASAPGFRTAKRDNLNVPKGEDLEGIDLTLPPGSILQGRVTGPDGRAVIGAEVRLVGDSDPVEGFLMGVSTDGDGYYRLEGLTPGPASVEATHPGHPRVVRDTEIDEDFTTLDLRFSGGTEVAGRVLDDGDAPVAGAVVRFVPAGRVWGGPEARSGADGGFRLPGVPKGDYRIRATADGFAPFDGDGNLSVSDEPIEGLTVRLDRGGAIVGRITGLDPVEFARVDVVAMGATPFGEGTAGLDHDGRYRIDHLPPGEYTVVASVAESGRQARDRVTLPEGSPDARLDLAFGGGLTLSGRAVTGETPVAGATLAVEGLDVEHDGWGLTDENGAFSIEGLGPGSYKLMLRDWQSGLAHNDTVDLEASRSILIEVPEARVSGRVIDGAGRLPLSGVTLTLTPEDPDLAGRLPVHSGTTDLDGRFELGHVADGRWRLRATRKGYAAASRTLDIRSARASEIEIAMDPTEGLTVETRLPSGETPPDVRVAVIDPAGETVVSGRYATGENGLVRLSSVPPGSWTLVVSAAGAATSSLPVSAPGATVSVALPPASSLRVVVPDLASESVSATVRLVDGSGAAWRSLDWSARPESEWRLVRGRLDFVSIPPGDWTATVTASDGRTWSGRATTSPERVAELQLGD